jgi:hypothetical protein
VQLSADTLNNYIEMKSYVLLLVLSSIGTNCFGAGEGKAADSFDGGKE